MLSQYSLIHLLLVVLVNPITAVIDTNNAISIDFKSECDASGSEISAQLSDQHQIELDSFIQYFGEDDNTMATFTYAVYAEDEESADDVEALEKISMEFAPELCSMLSEPFDAISTGALNGWMTHTQSSPTCGVEYVHAEVQIAGAARNAKFQPLTFGHGPFWKLRLAKRIHGHVKKHLRHKRDHIKKHWKNLWGHFGKHHRHKHGHRHGSSKSGSSSSSSSSGSASGSGSGSRSSEAEECPMRYIGSIKFSVEGSSVYFGDVSIVKPCERKICGPLAVPYETRSSETAPYSHSGQQY